MKITKKSEIIRWHRRQGLSLEEAIDKAMDKTNIYEIEYDGKYFESRRQLADYLGIRRETLSKRIRLGWQTRDGSNQRPTERWNPDKQLFR